MPYYWNSGIFHQRMIALELVIIGFVVARFDHSRIDPQWSVCPRIDHSRFVVLGLAVLLRLRWVQVPARLLFTRRMDSSCESSGLTWRPGSCGPRGRRWSRTAPSSSGSWWGEPDQEVLCQHLLRTWISLSLNYNQFLCRGQGVYHWKYKNPANIADGKRLLKKV